MAWIMLLCAGLLEVVWAFAMKQSQGFSRPLPTLVTIVAMAASFAMLAVAMKSLPLGTAYMLWTGIGAIGAFIVGIVVLGEPAGAPRIAAAVLIAAGIALMSLTRTE